MGSNANEKKYHKHNMPRGVLRRRRLVSNTDRFVGGTRMAHVRVGLKSGSYPLASPCPLTPQKRTFQHLQQLVAMLPTMKSGDAQVLAQLVELRARFHGWLHQDEFGPRCGEQTAAHRTHIKLVREVCQRLNKGKSRSRDRLDAALRSSNDGLSPAVAALGETAADVESALQITSATNQDIGWFSRVRRCAGTLFAQIEALDDTTDGEIALTALYRNFERSQTAASGEAPPKPEPMRLRNEKSVGSLCDPGNAKRARRLLVNRSTLAPCRASVCPLELRHSRQRK
jgi:hypothetical protein